MNDTTMYLLEIVIVSGLCLLSVLIGFACGFALCGVQ